MLRHPEPSRLSGGARDLGRNKSLLKCCVVIDNYFYFAETPTRLSQTLRRAFVPVPPVRAPRLPDNGFAISCSKTKRTRSNVATPCSTRNLEDRLLIGLPVLQSLAHSRKSCKSQVIVLRVKSTSPELTQKRLPLTSVAALAAAS